jgi:RND family efflux transporter, MFP subunit
MRLPPLKYVLPLLGIAGLGYAIVFTTVLARPDPPQPNQLAMPAESPYPATVSGSGLVEANTRNVAVSSFESGVVAAVNVVEGQQVQAGEPLFSLDRRLAAAQLAQAERDHASTAAQINEADALLADREDQYRRVKGLERGVTVTEDRLMRAQFALQIARAAQISAKAHADAAATTVETARVTLDRLTVRAPVSGRVLKVHVRPGEYIAPAGSAEPPVLLGGDRPLHIRVQVDENDVWRLSPEAPAEAVVRGNRDLRFPLNFVRIEPYVMPKRSLTGDATERIDTRVLEIVYRFDPGDAPIFIGQQMDVFIDARPRDAGAPLAAPGQDAGKKRGPTSLVR